MWLAAVAMGVIAFALKYCFGPHAKVTSVVEPTDLPLEVDSQPIEPLPNVSKEPDASPAPAAPEVKKERPPPPGTPSKVGPNYGNYEQRRPLDRIASFDDLEGTTLGPGFYPHPAPESALMGSVVPIDEGDTNEKLKRWNGVY